LNDDDWLVVVLVLVQRLLAVNTDCAAVRSFVLSSAEQEEAARATRLSSGPPAKNNQRLSFKD